MPEARASGSRPPDTLLSFDFGHKRIGVATGQRVTATASPLTVIRNHERDINWRAIDELVAHWQPNALVVGMPFNADGTEQAMTNASRGFAQQLEKRYGLRVHLIDERFTSLEAEQQFTSLRKKGTFRRRDRAKLDAVAAQHILERYFHDRAD